MLAQLRVCSGRGACAGPAHSDLDITRLSHVDGAAFPSTASSGSAGAAAKDHALGPPPRSPLASRAAALITVSPASWPPGLRLAPKQEAQRHAQPTRAVGPLASQAAAARHRRRHCQATANNGATQMGPGLQRRARSGKPSSAARCEGLCSCPILALTFLYFLFYLCKPPAGLSK